MLKEIRESKGISQAKLAEITNISIRTLQAYEQGTRDINGASLSTLVSLAIALECKFTDLLSDKELIENLSNLI